MIGGEFEDDIFVISRVKIGLTRSEKHIARRQFAQGLGAEEVTGPIQHALDVTSGELAEMQGADETLVAVRKAAEGTPSTAGGSETVSFTDSGHLQHRMQKRWQSSSWSYHSSATEPCYTLHTLSPLQVTWEETRPHGRSSSDSIGRQSTRTLPTIAEAVPSARNPVTREHGVLHLYHCQLLESPSRGLRWILSAHYPAAELATSLSWSYVTT